MCNTTNSEYEFMADVEALVESPHNLLSIKNPSDLMCKIAIRFDYDVLKLIENQTLEQNFDNPRPSGRGGLNVMTSFIVPPWLNSLDKSFS